MDESYRGEATGLSVHVPFYLSHVLLVRQGQGQGRLAQRLKLENGLDVEGLELSPVGVEELRRFKEGYFGGVIFRDFEGDSSAFAMILRQVLPLLSDTGQVLVLAPNPGYWRRRFSAETVSGGLAFEEVVRTAVSVGLKIYGFYLAEDSAFLEAACSDDGAVHIEGREIQLNALEDRDTLACADILFVLVRHGYSALEHAESCRQAGHPDVGYEILAHVPPQALKDAAFQGAVEQGKLRNLYDWTVQSRQTDPLPYFARALHHFRHAIARSPLDVPAYAAMADFWNLIGRADMAGGLLRSIAHALPGSVSEFSRPSRTLQAAGTESAPSWEPKGTLPRVLFVLPPRPHYGLDVVYDGLCRVLGPENVTDCPNKFTLHGGTWPGLEDYPCMFNWLGPSLPTEAAIELLREGAFDLVLYGDCENDLGPEMARKVGAALGETPLFLFDANDEASNARDAVRELLGGVRDYGYFKREMLAGIDYGPHAFPMPFCYSEGRAEREFILPRGEDFFWAGHRNSYVRRLYLEHIERRLGRALDRRYALAEYETRLGSARIGLNLFGFGFDTVRYWELPAHGCLLFSERPPIRIPDNFEDGKTAVFFDNLLECEEKLDYYLAHPQESEAIARAGHAHYWHYHTNEVRARNLLGYVRQATGGKI